MTKKTANKPKSTKNFRQEEGQLVFLSKPKRYTPILEIGHRVRILERSCDYYGVIHDTRKHTWLSQIVYIIKIDKTGELEGYHKKRIKYLTKS